MSQFIYEVVQLINTLPMNAFLTSISYSSFHLHREYEIVFVLKGQLQAKCGLKSYVLKKNDILLINSKEIHELKSSEKENICLFVQISPELFLNREDSGCSYQFHLNSVEHVFEKVDNYATIKCLIAKLALAMQENKISAYYNARAILYTLVAEIINTIPYEVSSISNHQIVDMGLLTKIIEYLQMHIQDQDDVMEHMCHDLGISKKNTYRLLKGWIGITGKELLNNMRIEQAKQLLKNTDKQINYIIDRCGYISEKTFYRIFKQLVGVTPSQYRQSCMDTTGNPEIKGYLQYDQSEANDLLLSIINKNCNDN